MMWDGLLPVHCTNGAFSRIRSYQVMFSVQGPISVERLKITRNRESLERQYPTTSRIIQYNDIWLYVVIHVMNYHNSFVRNILIYDDI